jgi:predicted phage tail component-like protein
MTTGAFLFNGQDLGALYGLILERRHIGLMPATRDRFVFAPGRHGSWDFGTELGERQIRLECFIAQASSAALETAIAGIAAAFDPTNEVSGDKAFKQLIFDTLSDRYFLAKITGMPEPERIVTSGRVTLTMRCSDPFAYSTTQYVVEGGQATLTGFTAYRQTPEKIGWNLVENGGFLSGSSKWTIDANHSVVVDALSPSGRALRSIGVPPGTYPYEEFPVEAGQHYSVAIAQRGDGTNCGFLARFLNDQGVGVGDFTASAVTGAAYADVALTNIVAPGNARVLRLYLAYPVGASSIVFATAARVKQQTAALAAWAAADQQVLTQKGIAIYEAGTNSAADGDMEAVGTASYAATNATLTKDTATVFAGAKALKVVATANGGYASQGAALAAGQAITASVRCKPGGVTSGLKLISTPSNAVIGTSTPGAAGDWQAIRVSGTIAGGDTGWQAQLIAGANTETSYFDNLAVENKGYDTMNADPSGQAFALAGRTASTHQAPLPAAFDRGDFTIIVAWALDHASTSTPQGNAYVLEIGVGANDRLICRYVNGTGFDLTKVRAGVVVQANTNVAFAAGDTLVGAWRFSTGVGMDVWRSVNGSAATKATGNATPEGKLPIGTGTLSMSLGHDFVSGSAHIDGRIGVVRILAPGATDAQIAAIVAAPYAPQDESIELAVWRFDGSTAPEDYASGVMQVDVGGDFQTPPVIELTAGAGYTGNVTFTDAYGNVATWNGTLALNDVLKVDTTTYRVYLNGAVSMSGLQAGSVFPQLKPNQRNTITVGGIASANVKALKTTFRNRWLY